jgi:hypothetical protein
LERSLHLIEIDIFQIAYRPCRPFQERIAEYYQSGKARFEWDKMRQKNLIEGDQNIVRVCATCNLNLLQGMEGCKIRVEGLNTFVAMLARLRPDTVMTRYNFSDDLLGYDDTRDLLHELRELADWLPTVAWPVAQIFDRGQPRASGSQLRPYEFYEWEGSGETFIYSNPGYSVCLGKDGIIVRESLGAALPEVFLRVWKDGASVFGETIGGRLMPFLPVENLLPSWDEAGPYVMSELRFIEMSAMDIFGDIVESLLVWAPTALDHNTGLKISQVG